MTTASKASMETLLGEEEWRMIHNALSAYQCQFGSITSNEYTDKMRRKIQRLMDYIRDEYIAQ